MDNSNPYRLVGSTNVFYTHEKSRARRIVGSCFIVLTIIILIVSMTTPWWFYVEGSGPDSIHTTCWIDGKCHFSDGEFYIGDLGFYGCPPNENLGYLFRACLAITVSSSSFIFFF